MSDMKTFTVRQLDRETARVLDSCDADGAVASAGATDAVIRLEADHKKNAVINPRRHHGAIEQGNSPKMKISRKQARLADGFWRANEAIC